MGTGLFGLITLLGLGQRMYRDTCLLGLDRLDMKPLAHLIAKRLYSFLTKVYCDPGNINVLFLASGGDKATLQAGSLWKVCLHTRAGSG